jgi:hypothetical protein
MFVSYIELARQIASDVFAMNLPPTRTSDAPTQNALSMRIAFMTVSLTFAAGCIGLWFMMQVLMMMLRSHYPERAVFGDFQIFCFRYYSYLPILSFPAVGYASFVSVRRMASVERFCLFASVLAFVFVALLLTVVLVGMMCGVPLFD